MIKKLRILISLFILLLVSVSAALTKFRVTSWENTLWVYIYPINGDGSQTTTQYINSLSERDFISIEKFIEREVSQYIDIDVKPVELTVAPEIHEIPPTLDKNRNFLDVVWWSLNMRYWAWTHNSQPGPDPDIQIYVLYFNPNTHPQVGHSLGLEKGLIGVVQAYSGRANAQSNNIVIAHEMLHTLGASDKYDLRNNAPLYPIGYAEPQLSPLYPQSKAELMAGRIPLSNSEYRMPRSFNNVVIGPATALEINWQ